MFLSLLRAILPALADSLVKGLFSLLSQEMQRRSLVLEGEERQAAAETAVSARTEAAIAEAEAQPVNVEGRLKDGTF